MNEKTLLEVQDKRDKLMKYVKDHKPDEYKAGYFDGVLDAFSIFKNTLIKSKTQ